MPQDDVRNFTEALRWGDKRQRNNVFRHDFRYAANVRGNGPSYLHDYGYQIDAPDVLPAGSCVSENLKERGIDDFILFQRIAYRPGEG